MDIFKRLIKMAGAHLPRFILALLCMLVVGEQQRLPWLF